MVTHCPAQTTITKAPETTRTHAIRYCQVFLPWRAAMNSGQDANCTEFRAGHGFCGDKCGSCNGFTFYGQYPLRSRRILCHCVRAHFEWTKSHIIEKKLVKIGQRKTILSVNPARGIAEITWRGVHAKLGTLHAYKKPNIFFTSRLRRK